MSWLNNSAFAYSLLAKLFHWLTAAMVVGLFALGFWMVGLTYYHEWYQRAPDIHISIGVGLALLTLFRLLYRSICKYPPPLAVSSVTLVRASKLVHIGMYVLLLTIFASGYLIVTAEGEPLPVFGMVQIPAIFHSRNNLQDKAGVWHEWAAYLLIGLASIHALAALYHHFWLKDATLSRMVTRTSG